MLTAMILANLLQQPATATETNTMITVRNPNPQFGDAGPFVVESIDALTAEMAPTFRRWAVEAWDAMASEDRDEDREVWIAEQVAASSADFAAGLEVIAGAHARHSDTAERAANLFRNYGACDETTEERADRLAVTAEIRRINLRHIRAANNGDLDE
jgi:hypothetical protein